MKKTVTIIVAIAIPLIVGGISAALAAKGMAAYGGMAKPPLSPPAWVFSVAWTILYILMGVASYLVFTSESQTRDKIVALGVYAIQLALNFGWSLIFFNKQAYTFAFVWLIVLWIMVIACVFTFRLVSQAAAYLMIPYVVWLTFAAYLNIGTVIIAMRG